MKRFVDLMAQIDRARGTNDKVHCLVEYFGTAPADDAAWAVYFLSGRRIKRLLGPAQLKAWLAQASGLPLWLIEETHAHVGDLAETVALLLDPNADDSPALQQGLNEWVQTRVLGLRELDEAARQQAVTTAWQALDAWSRFVYTKLLTGALRIGVSQTLVERALAEATSQPRAAIAHRLMGQWEPTAGFFTSLFEARSAEEMASQPYPFFLAHPIKSDPASELNAIDAWQIEWKWDGIRAQLLCRENARHLWSRGEQMIDAAFPELINAAEQLPAGTVVDGEILAWDERVLPFAALQRRLGRKQVSARLRAEVPVRFLIYDLLELDGKDLRDLPLRERRAQLETLLQQCQSPLELSPLAPAQSWEALHQLRAESREHGVEGLMLKRLDSAYGTGRPRGPWWKWKVEPLTIDAVLVYAAPGRGRRANLYTDYSFAVPDGDQWVPIAKAYSGLTDSEIRRLDRWIRANTVQRYGPVRAVEPSQVFELAFEGIAPSNRHKSGLALRFPRILRWREDISIKDADTLTQARALLNG